jgi:hypothetical protein
MGVTIAASAEDAQRLVNEFMASMGHLPSLEVFICDEDEPTLNLDDTLNRAASIQMLHGVKLSQSQLVKQNMRSLRSVSTQGPFAALFESLSALPFLKVVSFTDSQGFHVETCWKTDVDILFTIGKSYCKRVGSGRYLHDLYIRFRLRPNPTDDISGAPRDRRLSNNTPP